MMLGSCLQRIVWWLGGVSVRGGRGPVIRLSLLHWLFLPHSSQVIIKPQTVLWNEGKCLKWRSTCHGWRERYCLSIFSNFQLQIHISFRRSSIKCQKENKFKKERKGLRLSEGLFCPSISCQVLIRIRSMIQNTMINKI